MIDTSKKIDGQPVLRSHSFSGREKNSVFWNLNGEGFKDVSGVTGLDSIADGRAFAFFDYDHDGRLDLALTNTNSPQLELFRNEIENEAKSISIRLRGGNRFDQKSEKWSSRDGYGAHVLVEAGGLNLRREHRAGDGFAAQNSDTLTIGLGTAEQADKVTVLWPSGRRSEIGEVPSGSLVTVFENTAKGETSVTPRLAISPRKELTELPKRILPLPVEKEVNLVVTFATWCPVCRGELDHLRKLQKKTVERVGFYAVPIDPDETSDAISSFQSEFDPPYKILSGTSADHREMVIDLMNENFGEEPLPSSFLLDDQGRVLKVLKGTPTLSDLRLLLD